MRKLIFVVHTSIDGFVAGEAGEFDELTQSPENLDFVCSLTDDADALLAGRVSFQMLDTYWPTAHLNQNASSSEVRYSNWYNSANKIVLSNSLRQEQARGITVISDHIVENVNALKNKTGKNILMFGSPSVYKLLAGLNVIDEYCIIMYPVLLGNGISLFDKPQDVKRMKLLNSTRFSQGEIAVHYSIGT
ncbi:dihydrofolate reductase family protein [Pseudochryseolinea flava]|uniref:Deaminase n=1 Tax=Pseudochryseolinea flava TaxID=2059302 RepID=A0A364Y7A4_9BACT|nr:dihydrofolate reductase family protein [Pseudochryseolinea flava]RAW02857.1 deaminase [Pseudochryseolinea flava]